MILLPPVAFLLFFLILRKKDVDGRRAFLAAATFCGTTLVVMTELLSIPRIFTRAGVALSWLVVCAVLLAIYFKYSKGERPGTSLDASPASDDPLREPLDRVTKALLAVAGIIAVLVAITALLAPPSGEDGMVYHMPRAAMWINNHNVRFFPTRNYTQLIYGAFAEYSIAHTILLWGSDRFTNMIQFCSFVGCAIAVSYVVKLMGGSRRAQAIAAIVSITIPEGILEASGPMNTYTTSFWIITTTAFLLAWNAEPSWLNTICIGLAAGLAIFTKGTTYIILPFFVLACWWLGTRSSRNLFVKRSTVFILLILTINLPQYRRNYQFVGSPLGVPLSYGQLDLTIKNIGIRSTAASILRNISFHVGMPSESMTLKMEHGFRAAIKMVGQDPDDTRQVIWGEPFTVNHMSFQELVAGDPLHMLLLMVALIIVFAKWRDIENRPVLWYSVGLVAAFVAFCAILKWQRWSSRFHLPFFVLGAVIVGIALVRYVPRRAVTTIAIVLLSWGMLNASINRFRSLIPFGRWLSAYGPRSMMYFAYEEEFLAPSYIAASDAVNKSDCPNVGIDTYTPLSDPEIMRSPDSFFTYPIMTMIHADGRTRRAWFSGVHNPTERFAAQQQHPAACAVICLDCAHAPAKWQEYGSFPNHTVFGNAVVFTDATGDAVRRNPD
ncbi:MAG: hypothetical protein M3N22_00225 [Acidobacteriota bacterium]|nr:hypothetical protein [Acidobacteriota bacterium]